LSEAPRILGLFLAIWVVGLLFGRWRAPRMRLAALRAIPAFDRLCRSLGRAVETGSAVHVTPGRGGVAASSAADSLAGVEVLEAVSSRLAPIGQSPIVSIGDATLLPVARAAVQRPFRATAGRPVEDVRWLTSLPAAYAAGVMGTLGSARVGVNVMVGAFGDEYLLLGEAGVRQGVEQFGGAADPSVLPFVVATADEPLLGEDIYAAGAYLGGKPWHLGSLWAQDLVRWLIVLVILAAVAVNTWLW
jgi:hypothetical protein